MAGPTSRYILARDAPDSRDHLYSVRPAQRRTRLPQLVDLRRACPPVLNQGSIGTCTAHAVAAAYSFEQRVQNVRAITPSRLFIFYNERALTHQRSLHCVVRLRDAIKVIARIGVCSESLWRYSENPRILRKKPPREAFLAAARRKVVSYQRVPPDVHKPGVFLRRLKHCLADGHPFVFGFTVYESFERDVKGKWKGGIMPIPNHKTEQSKGGHAVMAVGYDDRRKAVLIRNSWGPEWGMGGYFRMPYKLIAHPDFAYDFWTIRGVTG